jgi:hypothetical protein
MHSHPIWKDEFPPQQLAGVEIISLSEEVAQADGKHSC